MARNLQLDMIKVGKERERARERLKKLKETFREQGEALQRLSDELGSPPARGFLHCSERTQDLKDKNQRPKVKAQPRGAWCHPVDWLTDVLSLSIFVDVPLSSTKLKR